MRAVIAIFAALFLGAVPGAPSVARAETCPPPPDHGARLAELIGAVQAARSEAEARRISNQMWELWADAPNEQAQAILDRGMRRRAGHDFLGALDAFDRLVAYCPDYAEGYNQRAFVQFLRGDYASALVDLDRALALSPDHLGALSGKALSLLALDRIAEARAVLLRALALNPWLPERGLVGPGGPLAPPGRDL